MTNPDWLFNFVKVTEHFYYILSGNACKLNMFFFINMLYVHKKNISNFH